MPLLEASAIERKDASLPGGMWRWLAFCALVLTALMTTLDDFIVFVALPSIRQDLHMDAAGIQWIVAGYVLAYGVMVVSGGRLGDIYGYKRIFLLGLLGFIVASMLCGLAPNALLLLLARAVEGIMAALMFPQVFSLIKWIFPEREQGLAFGIVGAVIGVSAIGGQLLGGVLLGANIGGLTWRPIFFINIPFGLGAIFAALPLLRNVRSSTARLVDGPGVLLASVTLLLVMVPLVQGRQLGWPIWAGICLLIFFPIAWLFVYYERYRTAHRGSPLLELGLFRNQIFTRGICILLLETALGGGLFFVLAPYLQTGHHFTAFEAGLAFTPMAVTYTIGSLATGYLSRLLGTRILIVGIAIAAAGTLLTAFVTQIAGTHLTALSLLPLAVMGFGNALVATPLPNFLIAVAGQDAAGAASGAISTAQQLGAALGVAIMGLIFFGVLTIQPQDVGETSAFVATLLAGILIICVVQALLAWGLPRAEVTATRESDTVDVL